MTVFFDIDTQKDFLFPEGALYVPGAEEIIGPIAALNRFAAQQGFPVISTMDTHAPDDPEFADWPPHCVAGTEGQRKPAPTLLQDRLVISSSPGKVAAAPQAEQGVAEQIILEKHDLYCFSNPNLPDILDRLAAERYVIYGVVTEICVQYAVEGLWKYLGARGKDARIEVVTDAVKHLEEGARDAFFAEFRSRGGRLRTSAELISA